MGEDMGNASLKALLRELRVQMRGHKEGLREVKYGEKPWENGYHTGAIAVLKKAIAEIYFLFPEIDQ